MHENLQLCLSMGFVVALTGSASVSADTYPCQPIDIEHYGFALTLADTTDRIEGNTTVRLRALAC